MIDHPGVSSAIDAQAVAQKAAYEKFVGESEAKIAGLNTDLAKWEAMKPVEEMNREEALEAGYLIQTSQTHQINHANCISGW